MNNLRTESEKITTTNANSSCAVYVFFAEDRSVEINLNASSNNRKTRHLLPRNPFLIPTISINVRVTTKRLTHESHAHNQLVFHILRESTIK